MIDYNENPALVTRQLVPEDQRLAVTHNLFGAYFPLMIEPVVYGITETMAEEYHGGYWQFWQLGNGGFYMAPAGDQIYQVTCDNYFTGYLSSDALGITTCLYVFSHLSFGDPEPVARSCAQHYHRLRHFMMNHVEVETILRAID